MMSTDKSSNTIIRKFYNWFTEWAQKPRAEGALFGFTFIEAIIFPIPPDPLLMAMVFNKPKNWIRYAVITVIATLLGGIVGYLFGWGLFASIGSWIIDTYHLQEQYASLGQAFQDNGFISVLAAAMTPIPYKIITISAGAFKINFFSFFFASIIGRSLRFFGVAYLAKYLGAKYKKQIEEYIDIVSIVAIALLIIVIVFIS